MIPSDIASLIDHTLLKPEATRRDVEALCDEAAHFGFVAVCVNPAWVATAAARLAHSAVKVCSVVGFPLGATTDAVKAYESREAIDRGAREIDMVMNIGSFKSGDLDTVRREIETVAALCLEGGALSKVIIEAALLTDAEKVAACELVRAGGADFVKSSTGFGPGGATVADIRLMRAAVGLEIGVKAAGGIRDLASLRAMIAAGATRIGTSAGVRIIGETMRRSDVRK